MDGFLAFSAEVTAFSIFELQGTGQTSAYLNAVEEVVGPEILKQLLDTYRQLAPSEREAQLRREIFGNPRLGPIARNLIKLWYVGIWYQLPRDWSEAYGAHERDVTFMVSAAAYTEGLLWPAVGAKPPGAKAPGYASWTEPPLIPGLNTDAPDNR